MTVRSPGPVVLYGATGYTGRLVAQELQARGAIVVLAGRNPSKLFSRAAELGGGIETVAAALDDPEGLRAAVAKGRVVVNCAGPFALTGDPVLRAAAAAGTHYLDTTGEQDWIRRVFEVHDPALRAAGVTAAPGMAFSHAPGDLLCHLVGSAVEPVRTLTVAYHVEGFQMSRGTMHSSLEQLNGLDVAYEHGVWTPGGARPRTARFRFPAPIGSQRVARYPTGEVVTVPRHVVCDEVAARISTVSIAPRLVAPVVPSVTPVLGRVLRSRAKGLLDRAIGLLPEGPDEAGRGRVRWTICVAAEGRDGQRAHGIARGPDIYGFTAVAIAEAALRMAQPGYAVTGAAAPAQAVDAASFLDSVAPVGVTWEVETSRPVPVA